MKKDWSYSILFLFNFVVNLKENNISVFTLGTFDGVHLGHQKIIRKIVNDAQDINAKSVVFTFFPHPKSVLTSSEIIKTINTIDERIALLKKFGIDLVHIQEFTQEFSNLEAEDFVKTYLVDTFHVKKAIIGYDHKFGKNRSATIHDLENFGKKYHFEVEQISVEETNHLAVSSSRIRQAISNGNIEEANMLLGYTYFFSGKVIQGNQLGRTIEFPTANIFVEENYKLLPKHGVYIVQSTIEQKVYYGLMNIGVKPTVNGVQESIEVHFLNLDKDLYHCTLKIEVISFIRNEQKFESIEALKQQINADKQYALRFLNK